MLQSWYNARLSTGLVVLPAHNLNSLTVTMATQQNIAINSDDLLELSQRIVDSGVLGRDESFDVSADSAVRVYVHQLRKKLDAYYEQFEPAALRRITIPKGQYTVAVEAVVPAETVSGNPLVKFWHSRTNSILLATACVLLLLNLMFTVFVPAVDTEGEFKIDASHPIWNSVLQDDKPILLVMGDYYIFGELNANGNVARMVREFNVNSRSDLEDLQFSDIQQAENYLDLDLSYMPEGSAFALARIAPILQDSEKSVNITMMSDLTTADIRNNHIVYIGYISALEKLNDLTFAGSGSGLRVGRSYDELFNVKTAEYYTSDAGLPEAGEPFRDYGMFATFPASIDTQIVLVTGLRDAGLMHTAQALSNTSALDELVIAMDSDTDEALASFEALYEVFGIDRMNFDANLVYTNHLDTTQIWGAPLQVELN